MIPWEEAHDVEGTTTLRSVLQGAEQPPFSVNIFVGPEGGFTPEEVELARQYGLIPISLGPRILRAETSAARKSEHEHAKTSYLFADPEGTFPEI